MTSTQVDDRTETTTRPAPTIGRPRRDRAGATARRMRAVLEPAWREPRFALAIGVGIAACGD
jgi:hypothetical protein